MRKLKNMGSDGGDATLWQSGTSMPMTPIEWHNAYLCARGGRHAGISFREWLAGWTDDPGQIDAIVSDVRDRAYAHDWAKDLVFYGVC